MTKVVDVVVVGAGVVGCAIARRFALAGHTIALVDRAHDVGEGGASKSSSAIVHTGFDCDPGSLEAKLVTKASLAWPELASKLKIPFLQTGAIMLATNAREMEACEKYWNLSRKNGVNDCRLLTVQECQQMEPCATLGKTIIGGLHIPREAVVDPFATCQAYAQVALESGNCDLILGKEVCKIQDNNGLLTCTDVVGNMVAMGKSVINSAGLGVQLLQQRSFPNSLFQVDLNPRRGQFLVYDKSARPLVNNILLPIPGALGKGILISPTIFGNVLCGPTAEDLPMEDLLVATQTTTEGLHLVQRSVLNTLPQLATHTPISHYAGARSNCRQGNYMFDFDPKTKLVTLAGIRSTGLSASFAIADYVLKEMIRLDMISSTTRSSKRECVGRLHYPTWYENTLATQLDNKEQIMVCFCEQVTRQDIANTLQREVNCPPTTDAIKRRTRATTGRCQGFNCLVQVCKQISKARKIKVKQVRKNYPGTEWFPDFKDTIPSSPGPRVLLPRNVFPLFADKDEVEHFQTIVVGSGPAGCGVLTGLSKSVLTDKLLLIEQNSTIGGIPARYVDPTKRTFMTAHGLASGFEFAEWFAAEVLVSSKVHVRMQTLVKQVARVDDNSSLLELTTHTGHRYRADAVVLATGARESTAVERDLEITGHRGRIVFANHLLETGGLPTTTERRAPHAGPMVVWRKPPDHSKGRASHICYQQREVASAQQRVRYSGAGRLTTA
ncbi:hypothetical protein BASA81_000378 [Batrachochytrium salamandrivorans]|nr:hypothetical protein BASA81_000378 [Batrachochytrium salamandrivorans]